MPDKGKCHSPRSFSMSRNRFGAGFNGTRTEVQAPCFEGINQENRLPSHVTTPYKAGDRKTAAHPFQTEVINLL